MRTLLTAMVAFAIMGCGGQAQQRVANPIATATASPRPLARRTARARIAVAARSPIAATPRSSRPPTTLVAVVRTSSATPTVRPATSPPAPTPAPTQTPSPTPTPAVASPDPVPVLPPDAAPQIVAMHIDHTTVHGGDTVSGSVVTSSNVASVEARIGYFSIPVPKIGEGHFALNYVVPYLPFFMHRTYTMDVIARNAAGVAVVRTIPIRVR